MEQHLINHNPTVAQNNQQVGVRNTPYTSEELTNVNNGEATAVVNPCSSESRYTSRTSPVPNLCQRLASMSTASSSVVVHPATSDQGSYVSETDSSRPTESVVDGVNDDATGINHNATQSTENPNMSNASQAAFSTTELQMLKAKAHTYLRRAFLCATCAIKKIFLTQVSIFHNF